VLGAGNVLLVVWPSENKDFSGAEETDDLGAVWAVPQGETKDLGAGAAVPQPVHAPRPLLLLVAPVPEIVEAPELVLLDANGAAPAFALSTENSGTFLLAAAPKEETPLLGTNAAGDLVPDSSTLPMFSADFVLFSNENVLADAADDAFSTRCLCLAPSMCC